MTASLLQIVESHSLDKAAISARTQNIHAAVLRHSRFVDDANFSSIHPTDLEFLFAQYDAEFFAGHVRQTLGDTRLDFGLSGRMTRSGGTTTRFTYRDSGHLWYAIRISTAILFGCFNGDDHRPIKASGILCRDRLGALQRVMEHEIVHLIELLLWDKSSCAAPRFHSISRRFFGHIENKHQLITPRERAVVQYGIQPGMQVRFWFDGVEYTGVVNRITKRATVLVKDRDGLPYSDGNRYTKFYVPCEQLEPAAEDVEFR